LVKGGGEAREGGGGGQGRGRREGRGTELLLADGAFEASLVHGATIDTHTLHRIRRLLTHDTLIASIITTI